MNQSLLNNEIIDIPQQKQQDIQAIDHLATGVQEVHELFTDMALLVNAQGENIDNIETNIQNSSMNIEQSNDQLIKANKYQKRKRRCVCKCVCKCICFLLTTIIIIKGITSLLNPKGITSLLNPEA